MKAYEELFLRFVEGSDKYFVVPVYQRNYDWEIEHCAQLFNDLIEVARNEFRSHFLGSIVSIYEDSGKGTEYLIIDGQQRITTISLLLLAMHNLIERNEVKSEFNKNKLKDEYLINKYSTDDKKIRLKPIADDNKAFVSLFSNNERDFVADSNVTKNYQYFVKRILQNEISVDELLHAIEKLVVVVIKLKRGEDDPQLIFESLNSTGLGLAQSDLVRNFILMKETPEKQNRYYVDYWNKIEINTEKHVSDFIRDYLTYKERILPNKDKVYQNFKKFVQKTYTSDQIEDLLIELVKFSKYYGRIAFSKDNNKEINLLLKNINKLEVAVSYPFLLELFEDHDAGLLNQEQLIEILKNIESFAFRRIICEVPTNALNKVFATIGKDIKNHTDYKENYVEIFKYVLLNKKINQRFPSDDEFSTKLVIRDVYNIQRKNSTHLLSAIENFNNKEQVNVAELIETQELNIEHIMPQTLNATWKEALGNDYERVHSKYLNTIGNITLTGYNSKMSNKSFKEKRDMDKGFKESRLALNKYLQGLDRWNEGTIVARADKLKDICLKVWPYPETRFIPKKDATFLYDLSDDHNFTGERPQSVLFRDKEHKVDTWKEVYTKIALELYDIDSNKFHSFLSDPDFKLKKRALVVADASKTRTHIKVSGNIFLEAGLSAEGILDAIRKMLIKYEISEDEVKIYLKNKDDDP